MPIVRASMMVRVVFREVDQEPLMKEIAAIHAITQSSSRVELKSDEFFMDLIIDPENFRRLEEFVAGLPSGACNQSPFSPYL